MNRLTRALVVEVALLTLLAAAVAASLPLQAGYLGWSWDALNHHVYLGLMAESPRLGHDVMAASSQSYQYPYLYWPVYRMSLLDAPGAWVGAGWAALQALLVVPPLWTIAWRLLPCEGAPWYDAGLRIAACVMGLASTVVLSSVDSTANDLLATVPLLWALAMMAGGPQSNGRAFAAAALWGVSSAFKLSNAVFLPLLLVWWWLPGQPLRQALAPQRAAALALGAVLGFGVAYAPWGWQLWQATGNPFYPYGAALFASAAG